ncbi:MAG: 23S rRNA (adenine(2503)-C(2))-methyltransferase RlmN [Chthoniobacterales bacterium]
MKRPIKGLELEEFSEAMQSLGQPAYRAKQVFKWLYEKRKDRFEEMTDLPEALRKVLDEEFFITRHEAVKTTGSKDTTQKFLFELQDGQSIESVLIPASPALYGEPADRRTLCVSTQVGCAYGCKFCASGLDGWKRNLDAGEIVEQILAAERLSGEKINNLVFMGMGEPLANFDNVIKAIRIINAPWGIGIGARRITVSTSGLVPQIRMLADEPLQIRLAISLHGATDEVRNLIMPINKKYPVQELLDACEYFASRKKQKITFEYILISEINDGLDQAEALVRHARALHTKINLIPYNDVEGLQWKRPSITRQDAFLRVLEKQGIQATIRREKGHDIDAACGQLRLQNLKHKDLQST